MIKRTLLFLLLFTLLFPFQSSTAIDALMNYERITAHRGSSGSAPENTLSAVLQAAEQGAGYAEIDVQMSADGIVVLYHDQTFEKLGLKRTLTDMRYDEILSIDAGKWFSSDYTGEKIPTLDQIMKASKMRIKLNIELKMYDSDNALPEAVVRMIEWNGFTQQCIVTSFDVNAIERVKLANPNIKTGLIVSSKKSLTNKVWSGNFDIISVKSKLINRSVAAKAALSGKELHVWTVNKEKEMRRILKYNVKSIITDYPDVLYNIVKYH